MNGGKCRFACTRSHIVPLETALPQMDGLLSRSNQLLEDGVVETDHEDGRRVRSLDGTGPARPTIKPRTPLILGVCFDDSSKQRFEFDFLDRPSGARPSRVERYDYEYKRNPIRHLFLSVSRKLVAASMSSVSERRTRCTRRLIRCAGCLPRQLALLSRSDTA